MPRFLLIVAVITLAVTALVGWQLVQPKSAAHEARTSSSTSSSPSPRPTSGVDATSSARFAADTPATTAGPAPCTEVTVLASLENADMMSALASAYTAAPRNVAGHCVRMSVTALGSGDATAAVEHSFAGTSTARRPAVWVPDSTAWLELARSAKAPTVGPAQTSVAQSAVVVAMPQELASAIGWQRTPPTWAQVFAEGANPSVWTRLGHPAWGRFTFGKATPTQASSGLLGLAAAYRAENGGQLAVATMASSAVQGRVRTVELATSHYMSNPQQFLFHAREAAADGSIASFLSAMIMDESTLWDYNRGSSGGMGPGAMGGMSDRRMSPPHERLVPVYPSDGVYVATTAGTVLRGSWISPAQRLAAADFLRFATTAQGQAVVRANGYRDVTGANLPAVARLAMLAPSLHALPMPPAGVLSAVQSHFGAVRKKARVLFLLDVSGSMGDRTSGGVTKLAAAERAVRDASNYLGPDDQVGLAAFSNYRGSSVITPGLVAPIRSLRTGRASFLGQLAHLRPVAQTPLYRSVQTYAQSVAADYDPERINAIVLLSDGNNDTSQSGTEPHMLATIAGLHSRTPVLIFSLGYGEDADLSCLQSIATTSGAHYYDAMNPATVDQVLAEDLITSL